MSNATSNNKRAERQFLKIGEVASELNVKERTTWRLIEDGELPSHQFRGSTRVKREDLDEYIRRCRR